MSGIGPALVEAHESESGLGGSIGLFALVVAGDHERIPHYNPPPVDWLTA